MTKTFDEKVEETKQVLLHNLEYNQANIDEYDKAQEETLAHFQPADGFEGDLVPLSTGKEEAQEQAEILNIKGGGGIRG